MLHITHMRNPLLNLLPILVLLFNTCFNNFSFGFSISNMIVVNHNLDFTASDIVKDYLRTRIIPSFVENTIPQDLPEVFKDGIKLAFLIAMEGSVLLKNHNTLPLKEGERIALFGSAQHWT